VKEYVPDEDKDKNADFEGEDSVSFSELAFRYATGGDKAYLFIGIFCSSVFGLALPAVFLGFRTLTDGLGESASAADQEQGFSNLKN